MIRPAQEAKDSLQTMRKTIKRREDKKLDFERYQGRFDSSSKKSKTSDRDRAIAAKAQSDLSIATEAYNSADDHLRQYLPSILTAVFSLLPHILTAQIQIQNTLLGHYYTSIHGYCGQEGFQTRHRRWTKSSESGPTPSSRHNTKPNRYLFSPAAKQSASQPSSNPTATTTQTVIVALLTTHSRNAANQSRPPAPYHPPHHTTTNPALPPRPPHHPYPFSHPQKHQ